MPQRTSTKVVAQDKTRNNDFKQLFVDMYPRLVRYAAALLEKAYQADRPKVMLLEDERHWRMVQQECNHQVEGKHEQAVTLSLFAQGQRRRSDSCPKRYENCSFQNEQWKHCR